MYRRLFYGVFFSFSCHLLFFFSFSFKIGYRYSPIIYVWPEEVLHLFFQDKDIKEINSQRPLYRNFYILKKDLSSSIHELPQEVIKISPIVPTTYYFIKHSQNYKFIEDINNSLGFDVKEFIYPEFKVLISPHGHPILIVPLKLHYAPQYILRFKEYFIYSYYSRKEGSYRYITYKNGNIYD